MNADAFTVDAGDNDSIVKLFVDVGSFYGADPGQGGAQQAELSEK